MAHIKIIRKTFTPKSTMGELFINGDFHCFTLEDATRPEKIPNETCIAPGTYKAIINYSRRFQEFMLLLLNVPNFEGIRIHRGNTPKDTGGCILLGKTQGVDAVWDSTIAYKEMMTKIQYDTEWVVEIISEQKENN